MIVVANGDRIIASNDEELADTKVEDSRILQQIKANLSSAAVGHFKCDGSTYFGGLDRSRDYYIYAYVSDRMVATDGQKYDGGADHLSGHVDRDQMFRADVPRGISGRAGSARAEFREQLDGIR